MGLQTSLVLDCPSISYGWWCGVGPSFQRDGWGVLAGEMCRCGQEKHQLMWVLIIIKYNAAQSWVPKPSAGTGGIINASPNGMG